MSEPWIIQSPVSHHRLQLSKPKLQGNVPTDLTVSVDMQEIVYTRKVLGYQPTGSCCANSLRTHPQRYADCKPDVKINLNANSTWGLQIESGAVKQEGMAKVVDPSIEVVVTYKAAARKTRSTDTPRKSCFGAVVRADDARAVRPCRLSSRYRIWNRPDQ